MIANICPIDRYEGPQWFVRPQADEWNETPDDLTEAFIQQLNTDHYEVLEDDVMGWGQHTHIIRYDWPGYETMDFLATITEVG